MKELEELRSSIETDVLVIGGGTAGVLAAIEAKKIAERVILVTKGPVGKSGNTPMAEGGIQASFYSGDSPEDHFKDTMDAGRYINNSLLVDILVTHAPNCIRYLEKYGVRFKKLTNGEYFQYKTSGSSHPRCLWIMGGGPGLIQPIFREAKKLGIEIMEDVMITKLCADDGVINGAFSIDFKTGEFISFNTKSIVIATGGNESLYRISDGSLDSSGDGNILAYDVGAELVDMEFIQFYPHALVYPDSLKGLIIPEEVYYKDLVRGRLINGLQHNFAEKYDPIRKENTTRDILARAIFNEIKEGRGTPHGGVLIDLTEGSKEKMIEILPALYNYLRMNGLDVFSTQMEVAPSAHYQCGGIKINEKAETTIQGLYAAGECTGGIDGANRLSSNALTEAVVFGMIAGRNAAQYAQKINEGSINKRQITEEISRIHKLVQQDQKEGLDILDIKRELQYLMFEKVGVIRSEVALKDAIDKLLVIKNEKLNKVCLRSRECIYNVEMLELIELCNLVENTLLVTKAAKSRNESRGNHFRTDHPNEDNVEWKRHLVIKKSVNHTVLS
ncbi:FAD-binding protein [Petroclostridium sp. X23]|uniref:FAD-binding protein n=1 Tax=Petroclostridium sp. X23 TaxID=3045146 RepID=UPI0024AD312B|nr:FAD-binding protein [Petroclostridium sp. X23]WHH57930.1 FAD-binding protein [Petroclostridium sp. X23]